MLKDNLLESFSPYGVKSSLGDVKSHLAKEGSSGENKGGSYDLWAK